MCTEGFAGAVSVVVEMSIQGSKFPFLTFSAQVIRRIILFTFLFYFIFFQVLTLNLILLQLLWVSTYPFTSLARETLAV